MRTNAQIVVFGAGAFGGWTALELLRRGARVRLVDPWGPGNPRASSGGDTRVIRATYGSHEIYTAMAARALRLWRAHEDRFHTPLLRITGALWMFERDDPFVGISSSTLRRHGLALQSLTVGDARRRFPQIDFSGVTSALFEPDAGYLFARRACEHVASLFIAEGGEYVEGAAASPVDPDSPVRSMPLADGSEIEADAFVFACGPWLGSLFPHLSAESSRRHGKRSTTSPFRPAMHASATSGFRSGSSSATDSSTGFRVPPIRVSKSPTIRRARPSIQRATRACPRSPAFAR